MRKLFSSVCMVSKESFLSFGQQQLKLSKALSLMVTWTTRYSASSMYFFFSRTIMLCLTSVTPPPFFLSCCGMFDRTSETFTSQTQDIIISLKRYTRLRKIFPTKDDTLKVYGCVILNKLQTMYTRFAMQRKRKGVKNTSQRRYPHPFINILTLEKAQDPKASLLRNQVSRHLRSTQAFQEFQTLLQIEQITNSAHSFCNFPDTRHNGSFKTTVIHI